MATYTGQFDAWRDGCYVAGTSVSAWGWVPVDSWVRPTFEQTVAAIHANLAISEMVGG